MAIPNFIFKNIEEAPVDKLDQRWDRLEINKTLLQTIEKEFKFPQMTPVQAASIPLMLKNKDVIVEAKTGSGKTLAFLIPIIEMLIRTDATSTIDKHDVLALVLSPTRELATQIHKELRKLLRNALLKDARKIVNLLIVGGSGTSVDIEKYSKFGGNIIVATPGRLSTLMEMTDNKLSASIRKKLTFLIFDEADQLLSLGFEKDLATILAYLPKQRRTSLFSATQTREVEDLAKSGMRNPVLVNVNKIGAKSKAPDCDIYRKLPMPDKLINYYRVCNSYSEKLATVIELVKSNKFDKILIFVSTCAQIEYFSTAIEGQLRSSLKDKKKAVRLLKLHRRLKNKRKSILKEFKSKKRCVLLATDILSRGIDVPDISCVIHVDLPTSPECYVHRSGRSGHQIELSGMSLLLIEPHEADYIEMCRRRQIDLGLLNEELVNRESITRSATSLVREMRIRAKREAGYLTQGLQAFVSYIRFYSSKLCLRQLLYPKLKLAELALDFGLVRLPKMPEIKNYKMLSDEFETLSAKSGGSKELD